MTKMQIISIDSTHINSIDTAKVLWIIDNRKNIGILWNNNVLYFTRKKNNPTRSQKKQIDKIFEKYGKYKSSVDNIRIEALYLNKQNEVYFISIHIYEGISIFISKIDNDWLPHYYFKMII